jgi:hypothetical protein
MTFRQKQQEWLRALNEVAQLTDKLGMSVDEEIAKTVAVLYLLGFMTVSSCGGHIDRITEGPYVILRSRRALLLEEKLKESSMTDVERERIRGQIAMANFVDQARLFNLLCEFYTDSLQHPRSALTLRMIGMSDFRLNCLGSELAYIESLEDQKRRLKQNRGEMARFTIWLKKRYMTMLDPISQSHAVNQAPSEIFSDKFTVVIHQLVLALEKHKFNVKFSCEELFDGANSGPYIILVAPKAEQVRQSLVAEKENLSAKERNAYFKEAMGYNLVEQQRLHHLIAGFYSNHVPVYDRMLIVQTVGFSNFRLRCHGSEAALLDAGPRRGQMLECHLRELKMFAQYLMADL